MPNNAGTGASPARKRRRPGRNSPSDDAEVDVGKLQSAIVDFKEEIADLTEAAEKKDAKINDLQAEEHKWKAAVEMEIANRNVLNDFIAKLEADLKGNKASNEKLVTLLAASGKQGEALRAQNAALRNENDSLKLQLAASEERLRAKFAPVSVSRNASAEEQNMQTAMQSQGSGTPTATPQKPPPAARVLQLNDGEQADAAPEAEGDDAGTKVDSADVTNADKCSKDAPAADAALQPPEEPLAEDKPSHDVDTPMKVDSAEKDEPADAASGELSAEGDEPQCEAGNCGVAEGDQPASGETHKSPAEPLAEDIAADDADAHMKKDGEEEDETADAAGGQLTWQDGDVPLGAADDAPEAPPAENKAAHDCGDTHMEEAEDGEAQGGGQGKIAFRLRLKRKAALKAAQPSVSVRGASASRAGDANGTGTPLKLHLKPKKGRIYKKRRN